MFYVGCELDASKNLVGCGDGVKISNVCFWEGEADFRNMAQFHANPGDVMLQVAAYEEAKEGDAKEKGKGKAPADPSASTF